MRRLIIRRFFNYVIRFIKLLIKFRITEAFVKAYATLHFILSINPRYKRWIINNELDSNKRDNYPILIKNFQYQPLISIITPVYNISPQILEETIRSVLSQTYQNWQLCLSDCSSNDNKIHSIITHYIKIDSRISSVLLDTNLMISGNSNEALKLCNGEFIGLLDHDDLLAPFALCRVVESLNSNKDIDFIYSDRDLVISNDLNQYRMNPFFKPGWSPELLLSANYLTHFCVISKTLFHQIGDFDPNTDGAQDWDLFLRVTEKSNRIFHIPEVLYHWRQLPTSMSFNPHSKPYASEAQIKAVDNYLRRNGIEARPEIGPSGFIKLKWNSLNKHSSVSVIIKDKSFRNHRHYLISLLNQIMNENIIEIVFVCDKPLENREIYEEIGLENNLKVIIGNHTKTFLEQMNSSVKLLKGDFCLFLNSHANVITNDFLNEMVNWFCQKDIGIVSGQVVSEKNVIWDAGIILGPKGEVVNIFRGTYPGEFGIFGSSEWYRNYNAVSGDCMMVRRVLFNQLEGFNEALTEEESLIEFCLRARKKGYRILVSPYAKFKIVSRDLYHNNLSKLSISTTNLWNDISPQGDQYFNKNLSLRSTDPKFKEPGE
jgi:O-antigen biosynthesis protein